MNEYLKTAKFEFSVFAERNSIKESLKPYPEIYNRIVDRYNLKQTDGLMFFDYPPTSEIMHKVLQEVSPIRVHYMSYDIDKSENFDYIKTIAGMIKYVCHNKDGIFTLQNSASFLGITQSMVEVLLEAFEDCKSIVIKDRREEYFQLEYIQPIEPQRIKDSENYKEFLEMLSDVTTIRKGYMESDINSLTAL